MTIRLQRNIAILSVILFLGKLLAWYLTHSVTILTDALESTINVVTGFLGLYSVILAAKPRDTNHPYGHGKVEFITAAVEGVLIMVAGIFIIFEAYRQLVAPKPLQKLNIGLYLIIATGAVNFALGWYARKAGKKNRSPVVEAAGNHLLSDAYSSIGIIIGIVIIILTKWLWLDGVVALIFAGIIIVTGYKVLRKSLAGIMDEADEKLLEDAVAYLQKVRKPDWIDLHNLRVIQYGSILHVDTHMTLPWYYKVAEADKKVHELENLIRLHFGGKVEFFVHVDGCQPYQCKLCALAECPVRQHPFEGQVTWHMKNVWLNSRHGKEMKKEDGEEDS